MTFRLAAPLFTAVVVTAVMSCGGGNSSLHRAGAGGAIAALAGAGGRANGGTGNATIGSSSAGGGAGPAGEGGVPAIGGSASSAAGKPSAGQGGEFSLGGGSAAGSSDGGASSAGLHAGGTAGGGGTGTLNVLLMVDKSWAMGECSGSDVDPFTTDGRCMTGPSRWALASQAVITFLQDPGAAGLAVALRFFPSDQPMAGCDGYGSIAPPPPSFGGMAGTNGNGVAGAAAMPNCDVDACAVPLVELAQLTAEAAPADVQEATLVSAVQASGPPDLPLPASPNPQAPTWAALGGAAQWASAYQAAHPGESTAIVLVTDGQPEGCDMVTSDIAQIAGDLYKKNAVKTFVIGAIGLEHDLLDAIAAAGGTKQALLLTDGTSVTQDLLTQLNAIRQGAAH